MSVQATCFSVKLMNVTASKINLESRARTLDSIDFEAAFLEHWPEIYNILFRLVGERAEAEDLALEAFWQLYKKPPRKVENLNGWLYRVAVNLGFNAMRAKKRRDRYEEQAGSMALEYNPPLQPEEALDRAEQRREVRQVLARMKPRSAKLLVLRHSGLSYADIAAAVEVNTTSVGKLLARAEDEFELLYRQLQGEGR
jgi:RNA polymerase sigma-70 factor (ECF subfamily)